MSRQNLLRVLKGADKILDKPLAWIQRDYARDRHNRTSMIDSERAVCFCLDGALRRAARPQRDGLFDSVAYHSAQAAIGDTIVEMGYDYGYVDAAATIHCFNDSMNFDAVKTVLRKTIDRVHGEVAKEPA
jgi:hypothetical protein